MLKLIPSILKTPEEIFFLLPPNHPDIVILNSHVKVEEVDAEDKINLALDNLSQMVFVGYAYANSG